jgi:hypothetical protein
MELGMIWDIMGFLQLVKLGFYLVSIRQFSSIVDHVEILWSCGPTGHVTVTLMKSFVASGVQNP